MADSATSTPISPLTGRLEDRWKKLLLSGEYSDMQIVCQEVVFKVHKAIICPSSSFFTSIFKHPYGESSTGVVKLPEDDPETIERLLSYLYLETYSQDSHIIPMNTVGEEGLSTEANIGLNNADVYIVADKFDIPPLKALAVARMTEWAQVNYLSSQFIDMAHHVLQLEHDPWPCQFVASCIVNNLPGMALDSDHVVGLMRDYGRLGVAVSMMLSKAHNRSIEERGTGHCREKSILQARINSSDHQIGILKQQITDLQRENTRLRGLSTPTGRQKGNNRRGSWD